MKSFLKQSVVALALLAGAVALWIAYVPAALPLLDRVGVLGILGIDPVAEAAPARGAGGRASGGPAPVAVVAMPVRMQAMNDRITAIGDGRPFRSVTLLPEVTGILDEVAVGSGTYVQAGTVLASLRNEVQEIERDRARLMLEDARASATRLEQLNGSGAVTELQRNNARLALQTAELALREAEVELARRQIIAPISGWVGLLDVEPGDQVTSQTPLVQIDDRSQIVVEFRLPERFVGQIREGAELTATPLAQPQRVLNGRISAIDNRVDANSRTLRVQAALENRDDTLRAGMAFSIALSFTGDSFPAVDPLAIQWGAEGSYVWLVREGKAMRQPVRIVQRNSDLVLLTGNIAAGDMIVTEGVQSLRPGADVAVEGMAQPALMPAALSREG